MLKYRDENTWKNISLIFSVLIDQEGNFRWEFDPTIVYDLIYADGKKRIIDRTTNFVLFIF